MNTDYTAKITEIFYSVDEYSILIVLPNERAVIFMPFVSCAVTKSPADEIISSAGTFYWWSFD